MPICPHCSRAHAGYHRCEDYETQLTGGEIVVVRGEYPMDAARMAVERYDREEVEGELARRGIVVTVLVRRAASARDAPWQRFVVQCECAPTYHVTVPLD